MPLPSSRLHVLPGVLYRHGLLLPSVIEFDCRPSQNTECARRARRFASATTQSVWPGRLERRSGRVAGKDPIELGAGVDAELEEDLAQVVLDRARADEQLCADLGIREAVVGEPCNLGL